MARRQRVSTYPSSARFRFGDGCHGEVRHPADSPPGIARHTGKFPAFALDADFPALLRKGAMVALGGQLDFPRDVLILRGHGNAIPLRVNRMGHYILSVVDFREDASGKVRGPVVSAPYFAWAFVNKRPILPNGGLHLP